MWVYLVLGDILGFVVVVMKEFVVWYCVGVLCRGEEGEMVFSVVRGCFLEGWDGS